MSRRKRKRHNAPSGAGAKKPTDNTKVEASGEADTPPDGETNVTTSGWTEADIKTHWRGFPVPGVIGESLRIAMTAKASAEITSHAKESLDQEVCGVLVGEKCEDEQGVWLSIKGAIRGTSSKRGGTHVTYSHETWENIYEVKDRDYKKMSILGWYHTHPGFGVEFSDMDMFIQENFFNGPTQFALLLDPVSGDEAVCFIGSEGVEHVSRFWVDGRERGCRVPRVENTSQDNDEAAPDVAKRLKTLEKRLQQTLDAIDAERRSRHSMRLTIGVLLAAAIVFWIVTGVYKIKYPNTTPPDVIATYPLPLQIGDQPSLLGLRILRWDVAPQMHKQYVEAIRQQIEEEMERERQEAAAKEQGEEKQDEDAKR